MNYYIDCEFLEGYKSGLICNAPTIDLISIGLTTDDNRNYYAISKEFDLDEAWDRYDIKVVDGIKQNIYWIRDNVLKPIYDELVIKMKKEYEYNSEDDSKFITPIPTKFNKCNLKFLIKRYGKKRCQIKNDLLEFCKKVSSPTKFYGFHSEYDWVALAWIFGRMIDLPKHFPRYCINLKQTLDSKIYAIATANSIKLSRKLTQNFVDSVRRSIENRPEYPKVETAHNALSDSIFAKQLAQFIKTL